MNRETFAPLHGRCQCGAVVYEVGAPAVDYYHCHCRMCRRSHGTLFATYAVVPRTSLRLVSGAGSLKYHDSSSEVRRHFCGECGCQLLLDDSRWPDRRWYTPGTLDDGTPGHDPSCERHIFVASMIPWHRITDDLPQHEGF